MIFKKVIQILIILLIILISYLVLNIYFFDKKDISDLDLNENLVIEEDNLNLDNVMENLEYKSSDKSGNNYIIKAKKGKINLEKENLLILEDVYGEIKLVGKSTIYIYSNFAQYNRNNFDTRFYQNVLVNFEDKRFNCDNLDLFFKDNFGSMYNNIVFVDENTQINADQVNMNLLNGDINIKMFQEEKKIKILKK
tara:strand:- start:994 stop:1578 length:585 start_codon:yes stop_codon:yes gene_type:complete